MRRITALLLCLCMAFACVCAGAEAADDIETEEDFEESFEEDFEEGFEESDEDEGDPGDSDAYVTDEDPAAGGPEETGGTVSTADGAFPELNSAGFLDEGEFVFEDDENGVWRYCSRTLKIEICRRTMEKPKEIWYEAEVWSRDGEIFRMIANDPSKRMKSQNWPYKIARKYRTVLAINSDFAQLRVTQKRRVGILLRGGEIVSERTLRQNKGVFPNLDTLAIFANGDMQVFGSDEKKAEEYVEMGAVDVLAFGPYMIRDGEMNTRALKKYGTSNAQRTAIGMVEPGHYFAMMLEGRHSGSRGGPVSFLAERMQEKGCTLAFNLDGGQTSTIVFMGHQICKIGKTKGKNASARKTAEILGIGTSELVDPYE